MTEQEEMNIIWNKGAINTNVTGNEEVILDRNHSIIFDNYDEGTGDYSLSIRTKLQEFMMEIFKYEGLPTESQIIGGKVVKGRVQPNFRYALENRLLTDGAALIVKYGTVFYAVRYVPTKWDKDYNTLEYVILEPFSTALNGRTDLEFIEIRNNWKKLSDNRKIEPIMIAIEETWELMLNEINVMFGKKLYNTSIIKQSAENRAIIDNIIKSKKPLIGVDFESIMSDDAIGAKFDPFYDFIIPNVSDKLIMKMDRYIKDLYEILGLPVNASHDKKGENLTESEVVMTNLISSSLILHRLNSRKIGFERAKQKWPEFNVSVEFVGVEDLQLFEKIEEAVEERGNKNEPV